MLKGVRISGRSLSPRLSWVLLFLLAWYVALCAAHYFNQRPLWNDEACVFESIQYFKPHQMFTTPLRAVQVFPRVYLFLIQQFSGLFDFHLLSLRFFSFVAMLTAAIFMTFLYHEDGLRARDARKYRLVLAAVTFGIASNVFSGDLGTLAVIWK